MKKVIIFDMLLNLSLGPLFIIFPQIIYTLIFKDLYLMPTLIIQLIGLGLLGFGLWQIKLVEKQHLSNIEKNILGHFAIGPAILLTVALITYWNSISTTGLKLILAGVVYMLILGFFYFFYKENKL